MKKGDNYTACNRMAYLTLNEWHQGVINIWLNFKVMIENSALEGSADVSQSTACWEYPTIGHFYLNSMHARLPCKIQTKHDQIRPININFRNLHKISKILVYNNPILTKLSTIMRELILKHIGKIPKFWKFWFVKYTKIK